MDIDIGIGISIDRGIDTDIDIGIDTHVTVKCSKRYPIADKHV